MASAPILAHLGVIRSRTLLYQSYRDSYPNHGPHPTNQEFSTIVQTHLPPQCKDTSDEVDAILGSLQQRMSHLDRLHAKHVLPGFADRSEEGQEIEKETVEITKQFRKCSKLIANLAENTKRRAASGQATMHELAMAHNMQVTLASKVQDASALFRRRQTNYMQRLRGHEERYHDVTPHGSLKNSANVLSDSETAMYEDMELSRQHLAASNSFQLQDQILLDEEASPFQNDGEILRRDREVDRIAKSIAELAELFQDLSALVIDQGTMLDRIDYNIEHMGRDLRLADREIDVATRYQKRTSRGQCMLLLIVMIILFIAIIIVKPFW